MPKIASGSKTSSTMNSKISNISSSKLINSHTINPECLLQVSYFLRFLVFEITLILNPQIGTAGILWIS